MFYKYMCAKGENAFAFHPTFSSEVKFMLSAKERSTADP